VGFYERVIFNRLMENAMDVPAVRAERTRALATASGDIVEIGIGTGLNLPHYPESVRNLVAVGRDASLDERAAKRGAKRGMTLRYERGDAQRLPLADASFDHVVITFVLCSVGDAPATLSEARRVLRDGGKMIFLEHVVAPTRGRRWLQRALDPVSRVVNCGCSMACDTVAMIRASGFRLELLDEHDQPAMPPLYRRLARGIAVKASPP
jgi:ubiquinone/menaquinone biosynthesis C-methylase UbiE